MKNLKVIVYKLKKILKLVKGKSMIEKCENIGVSYNVIHSLLKGNRINENTARIIVDYFHIEMDDLFFYD